MKNFLTMTALLFVLPACGGGGGNGNDFDPLELQSANLQPREGNACDVVGTIFNDDDDVCEGFIEFDAFDSGGDRIASARHVTGDIPGERQAAYVAPLLNDGNPVPCSAIARIGVSDADSICE